MVSSHQPIWTIFVDEFYESLGSAAQDSITESLLIG